ncbi:MAG: hypothetical protein K8S27_08085 [Candidatus Omnitrophica bacterium]|nr:hypothetical protein [Candidatus Omnitrophota bacterium]
MIYIRIALTGVVVAIILYVGVYGFFVIKNVWIKELDMTKTFPNPFNFIHFQKGSDEQRPYLIPKLIDNPPFFTIDGQSVMSFTLMDKKFFYMKFGLNNTENVPALNVRGKYDSPTQKNVYFDMGENVIFPNLFSQRLWTPWVNIQSVVNEQNNDPFDVTLTIEYDGKNGGGTQKYLSFLRLKIKKVLHDKYRLIDEKVTFGIKEK